jgi:hypothetical protein
MKLISELLQNLVWLPGMVVYAYNTRTWEAEAGRLQVPGRPRLQSKTLYQKRKSIYN